MKFVIALAASTALIPAAAFAQDAVTVDTAVIAGSPLSSADIPVGQAPYATELIGQDDLTRTGSPSLLRALEESSGQVQVNEAQGNPFQPNVTYRGFEASPLVGNSQGLAVYVGGVRFNQAFGDTVNWDLIPDGAIKTVVVEGANPVFGLNALGGSLDVRLKGGGDVEGFNGEVSAGSFGRTDIFAEGGAFLSENVAFYLGARALDEDGWRDFSPSELRQAYGDLTFFGDAHETHLTFLVADNDLTGNGTSPVELLAVDRAAIFTYPDNTKNQVQRFSFSTDYTLTPNTSVQALAYSTNFNQRSANGDAAEVEECEDPFEGFVCLEEEDDEGGGGDDDFEPLENSDGDFIPDFLAGGDYAFLNRGATDTDAFGATFQIRHTSRAFGGPARFLAGVSFDGGTSTFRASSELGALGADRGYDGPGVVVETDEIGSIGVTAHNRYYGLFGSGLFELSPDLTLTVSGRYNDADVTLRDLIGTALNGSHNFSRFNPAVGLTWSGDNGVTIFGGYSEANRAPTPAELSCADPAAPCSLTNFFVGDPPLEQVVARTFEAGVRGKSGAWSWALTGFSSETEDDIMFIASPIAGRAYFQNVGETRRRGLQGDISYETGRYSAGLTVALTDATFESPLTLSAPDNPFADDDGLIHVTPGDQIPGVARTKVKLRGEVQVTDRWSLGGAVIHSSGQYLFGDESNQNQRTNGFTIVNLGAQFAVNDRVELFGSAENLFDSEYETFGTFSPVDEVPIAEIPGGIATNPRALTPGAPAAAWAGVRVRF